MSEFVLDPTKNFTPRQNVPKAFPETKPFTPHMDDDSLRKLAREQLSRALQAVDAVVQPEMTRKLCAELLDRLDGKPGQAINLDATIRQVTVNASVEFIKPLVEGSIIEHVDKLQNIDNK